MLLGRHGHPGSFPVAVAPGRAVAAGHMGPSDAQYASTPRPVLDPWTADPRRSRSRVGADARRLLPKERVTTSVQRNSPSRKQPPQLPQRVPLLFINYRTSDSRPFAASLYRELDAVLEPGQVFLDYEGIEPAEEWPAVLRDALDRATVMLCLVGKQWLKASNASSGQRLLDDPKDWVRLEIAHALRDRRIVVLPILVEDAVMPLASDIPRPLKALCGRQHLRLRSRDWKADFANLIHHLAKQGFVVRGSGVSPGARRLLSEIEGAKQVREPVGGLFLGGRADGAHSELAAIDASGTVFRHLEMQHIRFIGSNLSDVAFDNCRLTRITFLECNMRNTRINGGMLEKCCFAESTLDGSIWQDADIARIERTAPLRSPMEFLRCRFDAAEAIVRVTFPQAELSNCEFGSNAWRL